MTVAQPVSPMELVTVAEAQGTWGGLWPEGQKPGSLREEELELGLWEEPR